MPDSTRKAGTLFVVATPIGNLSDMTFRAVETLREVDLVAAEDTRHSRHLFAHYSISTPLVAYHEQNESAQAKRMVELLLDGRSVALVSDAGTPLISDPGFKLVQSARASGVRIVPIPGCCAAIAALSVSGLPVDRFVFEGFLPSRDVARLRKLQSLAAETRTMIFYESSHRIKGALTDMAETFGGERSAVLARELTKRFETIVAGDLSVIFDLVVDDANQQKGEFVLLVRGAEHESKSPLADVLIPLMKTMSLTQAVKLTVEITGCAKNEAYAEALKIRG